MADSVIVMCSLPHGLVCRLAKTGQRFKLDGAAHYCIPNKDRKFKGTPYENMVLDRSINVVDKELWDAFVIQQNELYKDIPVPNTDPNNPECGFPPFMNKSITWTKNDRSYAASKAKELEGTKNGLEQINPDRVRSVEPDSKDGKKRDDSPVIRM